MMKKCDIVNNLCSSFKLLCLFVSLMVFNTTFNNISVISWWTVLCQRKPEDPEKTTDLSQFTDKNFIT